MFNSVWEDIKREFQYGNVLTRLIIFNVAVFIVIRLIALGFFLIPGSGGVSFFLEKIMEPWLCAHYTWKHILFKPWTVFSYMFLHYDLMHIVFNMLFLYWFGRILKDLNGNSRIFAIYVYGGLAGFAMYLLYCMLLLPPDASGYMLGASAGVMAVVLAAAALAPDYSMHLLFVGPVKLKYIAFTLVLLDLILMTGGNTGGRFAHLGGAAMGWFFIYRLGEGQDLSVPFNNLINKLLAFWERIKDFFSGRKRPKVVYRNPNKNKAAKGNAKSDNSIDTSDQELIDKILDKIKRSGYDSLTQEEREALFRASKK